MRLRLHVVVLVAASVAIGRWRARTYWRGTRDASGVEVGGTSGAPWVEAVAP